MTNLLDVNAIFSVLRFQTLSFSETSTFSLSFFKIFNFAPSSSKTFVSTPNLVFSYKKDYKYYDQISFISRKKMAY